MTSRWRLQARPLIAAVLHELPEASEKELRIALRQVYPFGERRYYPYKQWLEEVRWQLSRRAQGELFISGPLFEQEKEPDKP